MQKIDRPVFLKIKAAALVVGLPYRVLLEAVNEGVVPHHRLGSSRRLVRIDDILAVMKLQVGVVHNAD